MFNFSEDDFVPGFRVRDPKDEIPGFRMVPDSSTPEDIFAFVRGYFPPENRLTPPAASNTTTNLAFGPGGGLPNVAGYPFSGRPPLPGVEPVAAGDLKCQACRGGRPSGMTGAYEVEGQILCHKCAVKRLGFENEPSSDLPGILRPFSLEPK